MRVYGSSRKDKTACEHGCCGNKLLKRYQGTVAERACRKSIRKRGRREGKKAAAEE